MARRGDFWAEIYRETAAIDYTGLAGNGRTPGSVLVSTRKSGDDEVYEVDMATGGWSAPLGKAFGDGLVRDPASRKPIGVYNEGLGTVEYDFWSPEDAKL